MGIYSDYLDAGLGANITKLAEERKKQLGRISTIRGRDVLAYAVDVTKSKSPININYSDLLPLSDQLSNLNGHAIDLILETPGGSGETAEDIVRLLRGKYQRVGIIVPGMAKSAGTLIAMAADEILMEPMSALGPIDAQITWQGKQFSAQALLEGMEKIKQEVVDSKTLNRAYVPILQNMSPGELQNAQNALDFASELVADWLDAYKFKEWKTHSSNGQAVTDAERKQRARDIAQALRDHNRWKTHGRSLKIDDLRQMRLQIVDYSLEPELADAVRRYYTLLQMTFATNIYKIFETPSSQIMRMEVLQTNAFGSSAPFQNTPGQNLASAEVQITCNKCGTPFVVQARMDPQSPLKAGALQLPPDGQVKCPGPNCSQVHDLKQLRDQIQAQTGRKII